MRSLKELEEEYLDNLKEMPKEEMPKVVENTSPVYNNFETEDLKYNNEYGGFSKDRKRVSYSY